MGNMADNRYFQLYYTFESISCSSSVGLLCSILVCNTCVYLCIPIVYYSLILSVYLVIYSRI